MGDDEGTSEVAKEFGIHHIPDVARNQFGTPLIRSLFDRAQEKARYDRMCYVNADILLMSDFTRAVQRVIIEMPKSLMVGRRWNLDLKEPIDFNANWEDWLLTEVAHRGKLYYHFGIDYFVYPKGIWGEIPPFAVGRPGWDIWMLYRAHVLNIPMVDLTKMVSVVHQNHDYSHHPEGWLGASKGKEAKQNIKLAGEMAYSLLDAQYCLTEKGIKRRVTPYYSPFYLYQRFVRFSESRRFLKPFVRFIKMVGDRLLSHE
ncbi:MAG TPA: hypothetical protein VEK32_04765 [Thermodesulfobacteriota bacterium]|nr:hypothetical protein [Thermodesulfobacteriota bacterium]